MAPPPGPYSGTSTLALVARVSAFSLGLVYGSIKLKYLKAAREEEILDSETQAAREGELRRRKLSLIRKLKPRHITEGEWLCISFLPLCLVMANNAFLSKVLVDHGALRIALQFCRSFVLCSATALVLISIMRTTWGSAISYGHGILFSSQIHISLD
ncbi:hypothetical protein RHGRI_013483 [Rhododendron griersonianum]|uniref:ATP synthase subunit e, mitochondrial n=1 Tax=Rhododendron griersonianum TaxID=479676 RepID=A0AAV6K5R0_9ERIC|nr:hypothetical protein RHGRI_013483 [Rhododendron griersonianum]